MGHHTFDPGRADKLDEVSRYRHVSAEELRSALALSGDETVLDVGSGTGFYTDDVTPAAGRTIALDIQPEMHDLYRENGVPENVSLLTAAAGSLPFADGSVDAAFSTMTRRGPPATRRRWVHRRPTRRPPRDVSVRRAGVAPGVSADPSLGHTL